MKAAYYLFGAFLAIVFLSGGALQKTHGMDLADTMECGNYEAVSWKIQDLSQQKDILLYKSVSIEPSLKRAVLEYRVKKIQIHIEELLVSYDNWSKLCFDSIK